MTTQTRIIAGIGLVIAGGTMISFGAALSWGLTGAFISGGIYAGFCGLFVMDDDDNA